MMSWYEWLPTSQDTAMAIANIIWIWGTHITVKSMDQKPPVIAASLFAAAGVLVIYSEVGNEQYLSIVLSAINMVQWIIIAWQKRKIDLLLKKQKGS